MGDGPAECNIKVICRVRPLNDSEEKAGSKFVLKFPTDDSVSVAGKVFLFDKVFKADALQENVYNIAAKPIVKDVLSGYNGTIFAYGQTASGKTHTMEGVLNNPSLQGIIPRIVGDIFSYIYQMDENVEFHIKVSYFEIYMDKIRDLLDINKVNLLVHEDKNRVPYVKGATERFVSSPEEVMEVIDEGKANRHVAVTNMNEHSSRSHSVFLINVKQENMSTEKKLSGKLYLVDLAGSEKVSKTGAEGSVLDEAKNINKSLSALGNVIAALADCAPFIPYRDSKLTRILQESLGGNARTTMVICCSPASYNETETKSTLMFGQRAKTIKNSVMINEELTAEEWKRRYEKERDKNARLRGIIERYELELSRWRSGDTVPENERVSTKEPTETAQLASPDMPRPYVSIGSGATDAEKIRWDEEKMSLYQQLDDKDEEISSQLLECDKFKEQLAIAEEQISGLVQDRDNALAESLRLQSDLDSSTKEVKEVLQALEELAQNYDQKKVKLETKEKENETLLDDLNKKIHSAQELEKDLQQAKELLNQQKKKATEHFNNLYKELTDLVQVFSVNLESPKSDDDGAAISIFLFKLKSEAKIWIQKCNQLQSEKLESAQKVEELTNDLSSNKLLLQQQEAKMKTMSESTRDIEAHKRELEAEVDRLNSQCSELTAKEQLYMAQLMEKEKAKDEVASALSMKSALEQQMETHRDLHQKQLHELRTQISEKNDKINILNETAEAHKVALERIHEDFDLLKVQDADKTTRLKDLNERLEREQMASSDLKSLEDKVSREMQTLHNLRKLFTQNLLDSIKKTSSSSTDEDDSGGNVVQKQRIQFLENNLDQLTKVHKQLVRDNADLRCELPKLERRLKATMERIKALESSLIEAREKANKDRKRYQQEVEHIKEVVRQKTLLKRGNSATIAKPIRAGHAPLSVKQETQQQQISH